MASGSSVGCRRRAARNLHAQKWKVPKVQLRDWQRDGERQGIERTAIASADEANGWLKPEKNGRKRERKEAKGEAVTAAKCLILHPSTSLCLPVRTVSSLSTPPR